MKYPRFLFHGNFIPGNEISKHFLFENPASVVEFRKGDDPALFFKGLDEAQREGLWLAGWIRYGAGSSLDRLPDSGEQGSIARFYAFPAFSVFQESLLSVVRQAEFELDTERGEYLRKVETIRESIIRGDVYQVNLTMRARFRMDGGPESIFLNLAAEHPVPWSAAAIDEDGSILSMSPELFFRKRGNLLHFRPMKGTAPRSSSMVEDLLSRKSLFESEKNRAENLMIVDLIRNDASRICRNVRVSDLFRVEKYETVYQMTSDVYGDLLPQVTVGEIFRSVFPSGSVTGAPKYRAMEMIRDLENSPRGIYTGSLGLISPAGDMAFNVAIRTLDWREGKVELGIGSGIIYDSVAKDEYDECLLKACFLSGRGK